MSAEPVQPLRISKTTPSKMAAARPLSEIGSMEKRRNSPSYNQATRKMIVSRESSPFSQQEQKSSPFDRSPRSFWSERENMSPGRFGSENSPERSPSPTPGSVKRRSSIENLKKASRVKNSNIFALESKDAYDPSSLPIVERPMSNRPLSVQLQNNSFTRYDSLRKENNPMRSPQRSGHKRSETEISVPMMSPSKVLLPESPQRESSPSPTKSSLARSSQFGLSQGFDPENGTWSDDERVPTPRGLHRHAKSVTFHADPPMVQEYEQQTPEPSSVASGSRDGSFDSDDFEDQEVSFDRGSSADPDRDDSFDAELEDTDKTPVVLPEDWTRMSPDEARTDLVDNEDDVFQSSPDYSQRPVIGRSESVTSDGGSRPLPALPGFKSRRESGSLVAAAERATMSHRNLPSPPKRASCSKNDILQMNRESSLSLEDRLQLMSYLEPTRSNEETTPTEENHAVPEELTITNLDTGAKEAIQVRVAEAEVEDDSIGDLADYPAAAPRISRESILRKVKQDKYAFEDDEDDEASDAGSVRSSPARTYDYSNLDPDVAIPSRENSRETSHNYGAQHLYDAPEDEIRIKEEPSEDDEIDMAAIPTLEPPRSPSRMDDYNRQSSVLHHQVRDSSEDDDASRYSSPMSEAERSQLRQEQDQAEEGKEQLHETMELLTVKDYSEATKEPSNTASDEFMPLPSYLSTNDWSDGLKHYITPSPPPSAENTTKLENVPLPELRPAAELKEILDLPRPPFAGEDATPPSTPDSVIHHPSSEDYEEDQGVPVEPVPRDSPGIPERKATIKTNGRLKTRPSATPADLRAMADQRRIVSGDGPPPIPSQYRDEMEAMEASYLAGSDVSQSEEFAPGSSGSDGTKDDSLTERHESRRMKLNLDIPALGGDDGLGLGLDKEFDRVIESQKVAYPFPPPLFACFPPSSFTQKTQEHVLYDSSQFSASRSAGSPGPDSAENMQTSPFSPHTVISAGTDPYIRAQKGYLMRQNTKVVVASNRNFSNETDESKENEAPMSPTSESPRKGTRSAGSSPRKPSAEQFLKTEPWNGKVRRKSQRQASGQRAAAGLKSGPAPPLPGQESALGVVDEDYVAGATGSLDEEVAEGVERGRLFVKVVGVKDLDLPMPKNDRIYFQLTLDNGLHCVTTSPLELGRTAPIGQEFELVVLNDLEFQLTLTTKLPPPPARPAPGPSSPTKSIKSQKSQSAFSRLLSSPKKRAERERREREEAEAEERRRQDEAQRKRATVQPTAWDILHELVNAQDGSFARAYVNLKTHENQCFGRQVTVDVPCFNEWALEKDNHVVNSVRSKRGAHAGVIRRPPYTIGKLEVQLLYVPKPKGATDDDMPKSMGSAIRQINGACEVKEVLHEGLLSQQGGDCMLWRRRFFRLQGNKLTAYHEHTGQKRAVINLSKASRLVDDKSTLMADPGHSQNKGRRKSAFAEEDEAYQYVEEGFRIRFANGETIDFYADNRDDKEGWMGALSQVIGKVMPENKAATWTDLVLARERLQGKQQAQLDDKEERTNKIATEVRDFTKPQPAPRASSKSAPTSPVKGPVARKAPPPASRKRDTTPPMSPRQGHRQRDQVKSMIF